MIAFRLRLRQMELPIIPSPQLLGNEAICTSWIWFSAIIKLQKSFQMAFIIHIQMCNISRKKISA